MNIPTVCAIVLDYYGAEITQKCLISLIGQGLKTIYVLDNSRKGEAAATLHKALDQVRARDPDFEIKVISAGSNLGFGKGVNFVVDHDRQAHISHDYYLLLNNDAVAGPGLVVGLLETLKHEPDAVLVAPRVVSSDSSEREHGVWYHRYLGLLYSRPGRFRFHYFTGCCLLFSRRLVADRSLFDEAFFMYGEDTELGFRLACQGKKTVCATDAYVKHDYGPSVARSSFFYEYHMARSHLLLSMKTSVHPLEIPLLVMAKLLGLSARAAVRCFRYRSLTPPLSLLVAWLPLRVNKA
jgi:N-acetylglucosaminyl-diphospho-decaprenol L-rhamnosyltransferase